MSRRVLRGRPSPLPPEPVKAWLLEAASWCPYSGCSDEATASEFARGVSF